jgi:hypothetical protein
MTEKRTITEADLNRLATKFYNDPGNVRESLAVVLADLGISVEVPIPEPEGDVLVRTLGDVWERHPDKEGVWWSLVDDEQQPWAHIAALNPQVYRAESDALTEVPDDKVRNILARIPWSEATQMLHDLNAAGIVFCERKGSAS